MMHEPYHALLLLIHHVASHNPMPTQQQHGMPTHQYTHEMLGLLGPTLQMTATMPWPDLTSPDLSGRDPQQPNGEWHRLVLGSQYTSDARSMERGYCLDMAVALPLLDALAKVLLIFQKRYPNCNAQDRLLNWH